MSQAEVVDTLGNCRDGSEAGDIRAAMANAFTLHSVFLFVEGEGQEVHSLGCKGVERKGCIV